MDFGAKMFGVAVAVLATTAVFAAASPREHKTLSFVASDQHGKSSTHHLRVGFAGDCIVNIMPGAGNWHCEEVQGGASCKKPQLKVVPAKGKKAAHLASMGVFGRAKSSNEPNLCADTSVDFILKGNKASFSKHGELMTIDLQKSQLMDDWGRYFVLAGLNEPEAKVVWAKATNEQKQAGVDDLYRIHLLPNEARERKDFSEIIRNFSFHVARDGHFVVKFQMTDEGFNFVRLYDDLRTVGSEDGAGAMRGQQELHLRKSPEGFLFFNQGWRKGAMKRRQQPALQSGSDNSSGKLLAVLTFPAGANLRWDNAENSFKFDSARKTYTIPRGPGFESAKL